MKPSRKTLIKNDIVLLISRDTGILQCDVELILNKAIAIIRQRVGEGKEVKLKEFGIFKTRIRAAKIGRNLQGPVRGKRKHPEALIIPAMTVPVFKASKKFLQAA